MAESNENLSGHSISDFIRVNVTNSKNDNIAFDIKFSKCMNIEELKRRLQIITAIRAETMTIKLHRSDLKTETPIELPKDNNVVLGSLPIDNSIRLHVEGELLCDILDGSVEKFDLSEDHYEQMDNTLRNFLKKNQLGKFNDEQLKNIEKRRLERKKLEHDSALVCVLGTRCQVEVKGFPPRRGTIRYNGPLVGKAGVFIGVEYDEPLGKNDGSFNGIQYFTCPAKYGSFVSPLNVQVGDFPVMYYSIELDEI